MRPTRPPLLARPPGSPDVSRAAIRAARRARLEALAAHQDGVLSRPQLYAAGATRAEVRAELRARRWQRTGPQTITVFTGPLPRPAQHWVAVLEGGPRAFLDGISALEAAGLENFSFGAIRVSVPRGARVRRVAGVDVRQTRRWRATDQAPTGIPRSRTEVAAVRAALWAVSDNQAALILTMVVQQGLTTVARLAREAVRVRRDRRRALLHTVLLDLAGGARTVSEAEFVRGCRRRGIPVPDVNQLRRGKDGVVYLDMHWRRWGVVVEIDGIHHSWATQLVPDALRQNQLSLEGLVVLRIPLLGLRVAPDDFFEQLERALVAGGWVAPDRGADSRVS